MKESKPNHSYAYYCPSDLSSNEFRWTVSVEQLPTKGNWFFNFNPFGNLNSKQTGLYAGLQVVSSIPKAIFSLYDSLEARPENGFTAENIKENGSPGKKIFGDYGWEVGKDYQFKLVIKDYVFTLYIGKNKVGEHTVPKEWKLDTKRINLFVERLVDNIEPDPLFVIFSNFLPVPQKLIGPKNKDENPLDLNVSISGDKVVFKN